MFTGIIKHTGRVRSIHGSRIRIVSPLKGLSLGDSVAVNGVCLTVASRKGAEIDFDLSPETIARTTLADIAPGQKVHLETAMAAGDAFGGHFVTGHVDARARVLERRTLPEGCLRLVLELPKALAPMTAVKGSIAVDGVSLTVTGKTQGRFQTVLVPHTLKATHLGDLTPGHFVNLEVDMLARYIDAALQARGRGS